MVIFMRAALLQLYLIFSMRYRVLSEKYANPTLSATLHYALLASDDSEIVYSAKTTPFESSRLAPRMHSTSREQAQLVTSDALPPEAGLPIDTLLGSRGDPCQRPPPPRQPPPPIESGCCRCLRCHPTRGSTSNGRGGGWGRVTHSRSCGDGDVRGGGLDFNCAARGANWRVGSGSGSGGGGRGGDGNVGGCGVASTPAASLGPSPSKPDAATETRLQVEALFANPGLTMHPTKGAVTGTRTHPALTLVCPQPRRRWMGEFSGKLPHTPSATALPQRRCNLVWYPKDGVGPLKVLDGRLNSLRRRHHHERDRAHGPRGKRRCQPRHARSLHYSLSPVHRRPARGRLSMRIVSALVLVRFYARSAGGRRVRHAL